jgi:hypothetical protein
VLNHRRLKWLDSFSMCNFTNASVFDDTMPVSDGQLEIGLGVPFGATREANGGLVPAQELFAQGLQVVTRRERKVAGHLNAIPRVMGASRCESADLIVKQARKQRFGLKWLRAKPETLAPAKASDFAGKGLLRIAHSFLVVRLRG